LDHHLLTTTQSETDTDTTLSTGRWEGHFQQVPRQSGDDCRPRQTASEETAPCNYPCHDLAPPSSIHLNLRHAAFLTHQARISHKVIGTPPPPPQASFLKPSTTNIFANFPSPQPRASLSVFALDTHPPTCARIHIHISHPHFTSAFSVPHTLAAPQTRVYLHPVRSLAGWFASLRQHVVRSNHLSPSPLPPHLQAMGGGEETFNC